MRANTDGVTTYNCWLRPRQHNSNVETPSKANTCVVSRETKILATQKFGSGPLPEPDPYMHVYMCTDNVCTWSRAHMQLPGMPSQAKTKLRGTKHEISPPLLSIECIRYLHSTLPFKPVVLSNSNVSHISILFPGIFFSGKIWHFQL